MPETTHQRRDEPDMHRDMAQDRDQNLTQDEGRPMASDSRYTRSPGRSRQLMPRQPRRHTMRKRAPANYSRRGAQNPLQQTVSQTIAEVQRERRPRRLALRYGREWLLVYVISVTAVVALAILVHSAGILPADVGIERELQENRSPLVFVSMVAISWLGYEPQVTIIVILAIAGLWLLRLRLEAVFLLLGELGDLLAEVVKIVVARARPSAHLVDVVTHLGSYSFPSGHTVHYTVFYGFLGFVIITNFRPHWVRQVCLAICIALIVLVGPSRVYLGEHWPTDVLAGYLIGGLFLVPLIGAYLWAKEHVVVMPYLPFFAWSRTHHGHRPLADRE